MNRNQEERSLVRNKIVAHLKDSMNLGHAIYQANNLFNDELSTDLFEDEECFIHFYIETNGQEQRTLRDSSGSLDHLRAMGYTNGDLQKLLRGHSFDYVKDKISKREVKRLGKAEQIKFADEFEVFWNETFGYMGELACPVHLGHVAFSSYPYRKGESQLQQLERYCETNSYSEPQKWWARYS